MDTSWYCGGRYSVKGSDRTYIETAPDRDEDDRSDCQLVSMNVTVISGGWLASNAVNMLWPDLLFQYHQNQALDRISNGHGKVQQCLDSDSEMSKHLGVNTQSREITGGHAAWHFLAAPKKDFSIPSVDAVGHRSALISARPPQVTS